MAEAAATPLTTTPRLNRRSTDREALAGLVERVTFHNPEAGFCVLRVKLRGQRDLITVVGHVATIAAGEFVQTSGNWANDRYVDSDRINGIPRRGRNAHRKRTIPRMRWALRITEERSMANLYDRIGVDIGRRMRLEDGIEWATENDVRYIDIQLDTGANAFTSFDDARAGSIRAACERHDVHLGLHTLSAVNVGEYAPILSEAVDAYLKGYIDVYPKLGAEWIVVHAGYHFTADREMRMKAGLERLKRMVEYAEANGALLLLENLNKEPKDAEVHYLAHTVEEWRYYYERIDSPAFGLSFTANHAHLLPEGIAGFVDAIPMDRVAEVRLADCHRNGYEIHLRPGEGDLDFGAMFKRIEAKGFKGHYTNAFGSLDDMQAARRYLVDEARTAGVTV